MRAPIWLLALIVGVTVCATAPAQDPISYDPTYYDQFDPYNPNYPNSFYWRRVRAEELKKKESVLVKMENFTTGVFRTVALMPIPKPPDANDVIPHISSGPGSLLQQANSPSGSAAEARVPKPPATSLFGKMTAPNTSVFGQGGTSGSAIFGSANPTGHLP